MKALPPPYIGCFNDLAHFQQVFSDGIVLAIDFEAIDHLRNESSPMNKLSELGCAWLDLRALQNKPVTPKTLARLIQVRHGYCDKWGWVTESTCPVHKNMRGGTRVHAAQPYEGQFADSVRFRNAQDMMDTAMSTISAMSFLNRTKEEEANKDERRVMVIFWASSMEEKTFEAAGWNDRKQRRQNTQFFDFQQWSLIKNRWSKLGKSSAPCGEAMYSLGVTGINLHNAANDAYAEVLGMARFLTMGQPDFDKWTSGEHLDPIDMSWLDQSILRRNQELEKFNIERNNRWRERKALEAQKALKAQEKQKST